MNYIAIFHANLNYAYLTPDRYEYVIRNSYELLLDTMREHFPDTKYVFEASGYTLDTIANLTPDVLQKLLQAVESGQCEFMGSPYAHPMLPNFPKEDGIWSLRFSQKTYEYHLGHRAKSFWNPECGWRNYVPEQAVETGYENLLGDFEAYSRSCDSDGNPLRPEIYEKEQTSDEAFYDFGFNYDLPGTERAIHFPFKNLAGLPEDSLHIFLRTDRIAQFGVRFFMGMEDYTLDKYLALIQKYSAQPDDESEGALIIFADDAEYIGTNGWFRLKYQSQPDHVFEKTPESRQNLINVIGKVKEMGDFVTFDEACRDIDPIDDPLDFDDDSAWHGARASLWAKTPMAQMLRPWQKLVRQKLKNVEDNVDPELAGKVWFHLTNSYNSDGQWPPTLPEAPHIIHPFNYRYCFENLLRAEMLLGGVDRSRLDLDPQHTVEKILSIQQERVLEKASQLMEEGDREEKSKARLARNLVEKSRLPLPDRAAAENVLRPSDYAVRANSLAEARRLVGGIKIEENP